MTIQPKAKIISEFENKETNMASFVTIHPKGFCVSIKDLDSGEMLPTHMIFPNEDAAVANAMKIL